MALIQHGFFRRLSAAIFYFVGTVIFCSLAALPLKAAEPSSQDLNAGWQFRAVANVDRADVKEWHAAQVPGVVQTDLLEQQADPGSFLWRKRIPPAVDRTGRLGISNYVSGRRGHAVRASIST